MKEVELNEVRDIMQLQAVKALYCEIVDSITSDAAGAAARLRELFAADVKADYGMGMSLLQGCDAVADFLLTAIGASNQALWHSIHSPRIEVHGDSAVGRWTVLVRLKVKGAATTTMLFGRYVDEFRRTPAGWRLSFIRFIQQAQEPGL
jgi:hypothetical protein